MSKRWFFVWFFVSLATFSNATFAYLDPASGSMFLQLLLGGVAGLALVVKLYWHKLLSLLGLAKEEQQAAQETPEDDEAQP